MQIMEGDLARTIETHLPKIAHIQLADNPGRNEPGTGEINYGFLFGHLDRIGYGGWIGCEYKPRTNTTDGLGWFAPYRSLTSDQAQGEASMKVGFIGLGIMGRPMAGHLVKAGHELLSTIASPRRQDCSTQAAKACGRPGGGGTGRDHHHHGPRHARCRSGVCSAPTASPRA